MTGNSPQHLSCYPIRRRLLKRVVKKLNSIGIEISLAYTTDDVGISTSGGTRRNAATLWGRIVKGALRAHGVNKLVRVNPTATKRACPGVKPTQSYGHQSQGASVAQANAMRRNMKRSTRLANTKGCTTTILHSTFIAERDPSV